MVKIDLYITSVFELSFIRFELGCQNYSCYSLLRSQNFIRSDEQFVLSIQFLFVKYKIKKMKDS